MLLFKVEAFKPHHCEQIPQRAGRNMNDSSRHDQLQKKTTLLQWKFS